MGPRYRPLARRKVWLALKQSDPIDGDDPKVRAFLDNSEVPGRPRS
jgi:hypothetical protein